MDVPDTLGFLLGSWTLERVVEDHRTASTARFTGVATVLGTPGGGQRPLVGGRYEESGSLSMGSHVGRATRRLTFRRLDGGAVMVHFADGREFVDLDLRRGAWSGIHRCGPDGYHITTVVGDGRSIEERWQVRGPQKDYEAVTMYTRASGAPVPDHD